MSQVDPAPEPAISPETVERLRAVGTATLTMQLLKRGLRRVWMAGPRPLAPGGPRLVGEAFTLRFIPAREDLAVPESYARPGSTRDAVEAAPAGSVVVIDGRGERGCATLGDILATRLHARGVAGLVTDTGVRDAAHCREIGLPIFCAGATAPPSISGLSFVAWQEPIGCGGVAVLPGDLIVADDDGAVVVPRALAEDVAEAGAEQERFEGYVQRRVARGEPVVGLYPPSEATLEDYRKWLATEGPERAGS